MKAKILYPNLLSTKYSNSYQLLYEAIEDDYHIFWYACKDFAIEILTRDPRWQWLAQRIDDYASLATQYISKRMYLWLWRANFEVGALYKHLYNVKDTVIWVMNRWISTLKNLFDPRYSYHIPPTFLMSFDEDYTLGKM